MSFTSSLTLAKLEKKDQRAIEAYVYELIYSQLYATAYFYLQDKFEAEEVVNDSYMAIFKSRHFERLQNNPAELEAYARRTTINKCLNLIKKKKRRSISLFEDEPAPPISFSENIKDKLEVDDITQLMEALSQIQKTVFTLYEVEGYSHKEIASRLGISRSNSRMILSRAKSILRSIYNKYCK